MPEYPPAHVVQYEFDVAITASPSRVWRALTDQINAWWLPDSHVLGPDSVVTLEATAGGRLLEVRGAASLLWYTVLAVAPEESISLAGYCTPDWGGPYTTLLTLKLSPSVGGTRLLVEDALYGLAGDKQAESMMSGWKRLFEEGLRKLVEAG